jgi:ketosteroid isomerase-like protein
MTKKSVSETEFFKNFAADDEEVETPEIVADNSDVIRKFYTAFARNEPGKMIILYDENVRFSDPVFGELRGGNVAKMWRMLLEKGSGNIKITTNNIKADAEKGSADWTAEYVFSKTGRKVINKIHAEFEFKNGKIICHVDNFDVWKWARQALGLSGYLLGWSPLLKRKIRANAHHALHDYRLKK